MLGKLKIVLGFHCDMICYGIMRSIEFNNVFHIQYMEVQDIEYPALVVPINLINYVSTSCGTYDTLIVCFVCVFKNKPAAQAAGADPSR